MSVPQSPVVSVRAALPTHCATPALAPSPTTSPCHTKGLSEPCGERLRQRWKRRANAGIPDVRHVARCALAS
jgi:hypothetical protein